MDAIDKQLFQFSTVQFQNDFFSFAEQAVSLMLGDRFTSEAFPYHFWYFPNPEKR